MKNNEVIFEGRISNIFYREDYISVNLSIRRPGTTSQGEKPLRNFPRVIWRGEEATEINEKFHIGDIVRIKGYIDTNTVNDVNGRIRRTQHIYGESIESAVSDVEEAFGVKPAVTKFSNDVNTVKLKGELVNKFSSEDNNFCRGIIKVVSNNQVYFPTVLFFKKAAEFVANNVEKKTVVFITGSIQTRRVKDDAGEYQYYEDIVCDEIAVQ